MERLRRLRFCQRLGFTLDEIRELLDHRRGPTGKQRWQALVDAKTGELDEAIARAKAMKRIFVASRNCDCVRLGSCRRVARFEGERDRSRFVSARSLT